MSDPHIIARLADSPEFAALKEHFAQRKVDESHKLGRQMVADPSTHGETEAQHLKSFYAGVDAVLALPIKTRANLKKEQSA